MSSEEREQEGARLIPAHYVRVAVAAARLHGKDCERLLRAAGISPPLDRPVHVRQFARLWTDVGQAIDDDFLGLGSRPLPRGGLSLLANAVAHSNNHEDAVTKSIEYLGILIGNPRARLEKNSGVAQIVFDEGYDRATTFAYQLFWIIVGGLTGWLIGRRVSLSLVEFCCRSDETDIDYRGILRAPVKFSQARTRYIFDAEYLQLPVVRHPDCLPAFLDRMPGILLPRYWDESTLSAIVRKRLTLLSPTDWPTFDELAPDIGIPASTLRRKLRIEGYSYHAIKEDIRRALAVEALLHSDQSVEQVAEALGFAEPSAFHRAFRKWVAQSPAAFRRNSLVRT